jgi:DNA (cytosine-5)-methyltransferase 1
VKGIDLFAGLGGSTQGAKQAGCRIVWAGNHFQPAVDWHAANHPETTHACQDLHQQDWTQIPRHAVMLASPSCKGSTPARGKERPRHDKERATAWAVVSCAECHREPLIVVENVPGFLNWKLYPAWKLAMEALGYVISPHLFDAADFGVPQNRVRLFLILTRSKAPLVLKFKRWPHLAARDFIAWDAFQWSPVRRKGRARATLDRVRDGRKHFGNEFLMPYYSSGSGESGRSLDRPIGTITTRERWAVVRGDQMRMLHRSEYRALMGFPKTYQLPDNQKLAVHLLGNAVPPPMMERILSRLMNN